VTAAELIDVTETLKCQAAIHGGAAVEQSTVEVLCYCTVHTDRVHRNGLPYILRKVRGLGDRASFHSDTGLQASPPAQSQSHRVTA
jgi:hypothetical protein